jgi:dihydroflavonol-4-reductase
MGSTLVTGGTGLIGFNVVLALLRRGRPVKALVRSLEKGHELLPEACVLAQGDVTDAASVRRALQGCSVVYHVAGIPEQWLRDPARFEQVNAGGTRNMVKAALAQGVERFVYTSTIDVLAGEAGKECDETRLAEEPLATPYERSKQAAHQTVAEAVGRGLPAVLLHPAAPYGPGPTETPGLNNVIGKLLRGQMPALTPGGTALVFAPDIGEGHVLAEEKGVVGERYILSESYCTLAELAQAVYAEAGMDRKLPPTLPLGMAQGMAGASEFLAKLTGKPPMIAKGQLHFMQWQAFPVGRKAQRELGWTPTPLREGLRQTIAYLGFSIND